MITRNQLFRFSFFLQTSFRKLWKPTFHSEKFNRYRIGQTETVMSGLIVLLKQFVLTLCHEHFKNIDPSIHIRFKSLNYFPSAHANFIQYFKQLVRHYAICNVLGIFDFSAVKRVNVSLNMFYFEVFMRYGWGRFALKTI